MLPFIGETLRDKLNREIQLGIDGAVGVVVGCVRSAQTVTFIRESPTTSRPPSPAATSSSATWAKGGMDRP